jgi:hypothetical protein
MSWKLSNKDWVKKIVWPFKWFYQRVKRLIEFTPIVWNSYDWDYQYSIDLFKFQLLRTAKYLEKYGHLENSKYNAQRIRTVCRLMDKVYNEEYQDEAYDKLTKLYGKAAFRFETVPTEGDIYSLKMKYESYPNAEEIRKTSQEYIKKAQEKQEKAHRLLWKLIEHNIRGWWD